MTERTKLVCARAVDAAPVAAGTVYSFKCGLCGQHVCVAPTSQAVLALNPQIEIVCMRCFKPEPGDVWAVPDGALDEVARTLRK